MAMLYSVGKTFVSAEELSDKRATGTLTKFLGDGPAATIEFSAGLVKRRDLADKVMRRDGTVAFTNIGIGKPLTIEIQRIYTGDCPRNAFSKHFLCASAFRQESSYEGAPRNINVLRNNIDKHQHIDMLSATESGTTLLYYTPALTSTSQLVTIEMTIDKFPDEFFKQVSDSLASAAGIPLFATKSLFLLAGSFLMKLIGKVGKSLFDGRPFFQATDRINFGRPPYTDSVAGQAIWIDPEYEEDIRNNYTLAPDGKLTAKADGRVYDGPIPYVTVILDGAKRPEYENFAPTQASAQLLDKFYNIGENASISASDLLEILKVYNDYNYKRKALELKKWLDGHEADKESEDYKEKDALYKAYLENILTDLFKN